MMHLKSAFPITFLLLLCLSCKKSGTDETPEPVQTKKVLNRIVEVSSEQVGNTATFTDFTYDEQGRLIKEKHPRYEINYFYKLGELFRLTEETEFKKTMVDFSYESGRIKKATFDIKGLVPAKFDLVYIYEGGKHIRIDRVVDELVFVKTELQYIGEKISKLVSDDYKYVTVKEFTSDDKKNIYHDLGKELTFAIACLKFKPGSVNNILTEKTTYYQDGVLVPSSIEISNRYTYDSDGYPLTLINKSKHSSQSVGTETKFTYEYKPVK